METIAEPKKILLSFENKKSIWQIDLDNLLENNDIEKVRNNIEELIVSVIQNRFCGFLENYYQINVFLNEINEYINSKNAIWKKDELKLKKTFRRKNRIYEIIYHDYTYKYNVFKKEVDFYDNGIKFLTYSSNWVKDNIGDEHSICIYALRWVEKNGSEIFNKNYPIRKD